MSPDKTTKLLFSLCLGVLSSALLWAQMTVTGSISGTIVDPSGKTVPGVKITLTSENTKEIREATSNEAGTISLAALPPDIYSITMAHSGFNTFLRPAITLTANERIPLAEIAL